MSLRYLYLLSLLLLSGCGSWVGEDDEIVDPPAELMDFQTTLKVNELWDRNTGKGADKQYLVLQPLIDGERIYISDADDTLIAINVANGRSLWTYKLKLGGGSFFSSGDKVYITSGPGYGNNTVMLGTNNGDVIALGAETGKQLWRSRVSSEILSPPQRTGDMVIVRTLDGKIFGLSGDSGRRLWSYEKNAPSLSLRGTSTPIISGNSVISGFDGGNLSALDLDSGRLLWESGISTPRGRSELERLVDIDAPPIVSGAIVYTVTFQGQLAALAMDTGRMLWNREISSHVGFSVDSDFIYVTDDKSNIWAFDRFNGGSVWKQDSLLNRQLTAPAVAGDYLVVADFEGYVHWLDKYTGTLVARQRISRDRVLARPVAYGNVVYVFASNGELAALSYDPPPQED